MGAISLIYGEPSWLRLVKCTLTSGGLVSGYTKYDFPGAVKAAPSFVSASGSEVKYFTESIANGNSMSVPDNSENINIMTGDVISANAGSPKMDCEVKSSVTNRPILLAANELDANGNVPPVIAIREIGFKSDSGSPVVAGYEYILGTFADLKEDPKKGPSSFTFSIVGKTDQGFTTGGAMSDFNTAATGGGNTITPSVDRPAIGARTITDLTTDDWTRLKTGKIVTKMT